MNTCDFLKLSSEYYNMITPPFYGLRRKNGFEIVRYIILKMNNPNILEIGMNRSEKNWDNDGFSTIIFAWLVAKTHGKLVSVDISANAINITKKVLHDFKIDFYPNIHLTKADGIEFCKNYNDKIDFLYLDAVDWMNDKKKESEIFHLECLKILENNGCIIENKTYVMIDDILDDETYEGKGKLVIPYMIEKGYQMIIKGYQFMFLR